jgi:hypothetical protein
MKQKSVLNIGSENIAKAQTYRVEKINFSELIGIFPGSISGKMHKNQTLQ